LAEKKALTLNALEPTLLPAKPQETLELDELGPLWAIAAVGWFGCG